MTCESASVMSVLGLIVLPLSIYLSVRLGSAAYFRSKTEHESQTTKRKE